VEYEHRELTPTEQKWNQEPLASEGRTTPLGIRQCARRPKGTEQWFVHHETEEQFKARSGRKSG
jgi:hypothetical protein